MAVAIVVADERATRAARLADRAFPAASLVKLGVAMSWAERLRTGAATWGDTLAVPDSLRAEAGIAWFRISRLHDPEKSLHDQRGGTATLHDLLDLMLAQSSNLATAVLIDAMGREEIQRRLDADGLDGMQLRHNFGDATLSGRNTTTAGAAAGAMMKLLQPGAGRDAVADSMYAMLGRQRFRGGLPRVLPMGTANKTGTSGRTNHDVAAFRRRDGTLVVTAVLTQGFRREASAQQAMHRIGRQVVRACRTTETTR
jgi:beta-lactamase class A